MKGNPQNDAQRNNIYSFYKCILDKNVKNNKKPDFATFRDAHYIQKVVEAILVSNKEKKWKKIEL